MKPTGELSLPRPRPARLAVAVLAGGRSTRMGRDKAKALLRGKTLLAHARSAARALGAPVRVVRRDLVPKCGPLGGIYTALKTFGAETVLFLACDMPFVSGELLRELVKELHGRSVSRREPRGPLTRPSGTLSPSEGERAGVRGQLRSLPTAVFVAVDGVAGFPFALRKSALPLVETQIERGEFSLQALARALGAKRVSAQGREGELVNINTPAELARARKQEKLISRKSRLS